MEVEATGGDLGEKDVSKPTVADVVEDAEGKPAKVVVQKGAVFRKKLDIPADRVQTVEGANKSNDDAGKVTVEVSAGEMKALKAGSQEEQLSDDDFSLLDQAERKVPTAEGMRELESLPDSRGDETSPEPGAGRVSPGKPGRLKQILSIIGPGFLTGMAGNDSSAVGAYSIDGASVGYGHLWLMLLSTPLYQAVQYACARIGRITQRGMAEILREHYGRGVAVLASLVLIIANIALIAADLAAIGSGLQLITGISYLWFIVPIVAILWYLTVYRSFEGIKKIFIALSLAFVAYIITAIFSGANWGQVLFHTFVPQVNFTFASISSAVALLGATISPYTMFWQVQGEKEQKRTGSTRNKLHMAALDIGVGVVSGNLVAYFIIICTAATIFVHHGQIATAADAARALSPLLGPFATYLFAIGLIGAGVIAIPILLASTSYAVAGTIGWPGGLSKKPWQNEGFYLILTAALVVSLILALLRIDPIRLIFWANVLSGVLSPVMIVFVILVGNNRRVMDNQRLGPFTNIGLGVAFLVIAAATVLLFYGLFTGQG
jgi:NRAMP (natural resistance-associated macrophage protein)-like metal ion transporter